MAGHLNFNNSRGRLAILTLPLENC